MRSNSSDADVGSHWKRTATRVSAPAITTPIATSWTIPLRTENETTPSRRSTARGGDGRFVANLGPCEGPAFSCRERRSSQSSSARFSTIASRRVRCRSCGPTRPVWPRSLPWGAASRSCSRSEGTSTSMANNHGMDYGEAGLRDSLAAAKRYRFPVIGIGLDGKRAYAPYRRTIRGQRISIIAATQVLDDHLISSWTAGPGKPGLASAKDVPRLVQEVRRARATSDTVVVYLHWGVELEGCPTSDQRTLARQLVAAGADIVVGGHAHRLLGAGRMGKALVDYGLGNFVWYGTSELSTQTGVLFVTATGRRIDSYRWVPARIADGVPRPLSGADRNNELRSWRSLRGCAGLRP